MVYYFTIEAWQKLDKSKGERFSFEALGFRVSGLRICIIGFCVLGFGVFPLMRLRAGEGDLWVLSVRTLSSIDV